MRHLYQSDVTVAALIIPSEKLTLELDVCFTMLTGHNRSACCKGGEALAEGTVIGNSGWPLLSTEYLLV
jgi:hypothetical protein